MSIISRIQDAISSDKNDGSDAEEYTSYECPNCEEVVTPTEGLRVDSMRTSEKSALLVCENCGILFDIRYVKQKKGSEE